MKEQAMSDENAVKAMGQVIQIDEASIRGHLGEMVRGTVEETLIPSRIDQNRCAHWCNPMDMIRQG
jgi:hypothetical protein